MDKLSEKRIAAMKQVWSKYGLDSDFNDFMEEQDEAYNKPDTNPTGEKVCNFLEQEAGWHKLLPKSRQDINEATKDIIEFPEDDYVLESIIRNMRIEGKSSKRTVVAMRDYLGRKGKGEQ